MAASPTDSATFTPPYISFSQLVTVLDRMKNEGVPSRVDRSYLSSWSGTSQAQFLKAARALDLLDDQGRPTEILKRLATESGSRKQIVGDLVRAKYPEAVGLAPNATQQELTEVFNRYDGISGETTRKAITFYLHAAQFAGVPLSPFFKVGKPSGGGGSRPSGGGGPRSSFRRRSRPTGGAQEPALSPPPTEPEAPKMHPAILTLVQNLPPFEDDLTKKPDFGSAERKAWFAYAEATFNLIYSLPDDDAGGSP